MPETRKNTVALMVPTRGDDIVALFMSQVMELNNFDRAKGYNLLTEIRYQQGGDIARQRNSLARQFLDDTDAEWCWMCDTDMVLKRNPSDEPDAMYRLIAAATATESDVMGALCVMVTADRPIPVLFREDPDTVTQAALDWPRDATVLDVGATGTGCVMIHRRVLEAMRSDDHNFGWFQAGPIQADNGKWHWCGEDVTFCLRAKKAGFSVRVDCTTHVGHYKSPRVWWPDDIDNVPDDAPVPHYDA